MKKADCIAPIGSFCIYFCDLYADMNEECAVLAAALSHSRFPCLNIEVDVLHDIIGPGGVQGFIAGIHIVPYIVAGKEFRHLPASQVLGVFVGFYAINEEIALFGHIHPSFGTISHS